MPKTNYLRLILRHKIILKLNRGFAIVDNLVVISLLAVLMSASSSFFASQFRSIRSVDVSQNSIDVASGLGMIINNRAACKAAFEDKMVNPGGGPSALSDIIINGTKLIDVTTCDDPAFKALNRDLRTTSISLRRVSNPVAITDKDGTNNLFKVIVQLTVQQEKCALAGQTNDGGNAVDTKEFLLVAHVRNNRIRDCYGGTSTDFLPEVCERMLGGIYDENQQPSCLLNWLALAPTVADRAQAFNRGPAPAANPWAFLNDGRPGFTVFGDLIATGLVIGVDSYGPWFGGAGRAYRTWIGGCSGTCSNYGGAVGNTYFHISGRVNSDPDFPNENVTDSPRIIGLLDNVVLPEATARLGIGTGGDLPAGALAVKAEITQVANFTSKDVSAELQFVSGNRTWEISAINSDLRFTHAGLPVLKFDNDGLEVLVGPPSDRRLKTNIDELGPVLTKIKQLNPVSFNFKKSPERSEDGLLAQEVKKIFPELVISSSDGYLGLFYDRIGPILINGVKELNNKVSEMPAHQIYTANDRAAKISKSNEKLSEDIDEIAAQLKELVRHLSEVKEI